MDFSSFNVKPFNFRLSIIRGDANICFIHMMVKRADKLQAFLGTQKGADLLAAWRRVNNILPADMDRYKYVVNNYQPKHEAELPLLQAMRRINRMIKNFEGLTKISIEKGSVPLVKPKVGELPPPLENELLSLSGPINRFLDQVRVLDIDDKALRQNRLNLLGLAREAIRFCIADLSYIHPPGADERPSSPNNAASP